MKICITARGDNLGSYVDSRFGRCQNFLIVDTETMEFETVKNPNMDISGGAGIQSGQLMADKGVKAVITGNVGPNAFQTLSAAGVDVITGASGVIRDVVDKYKNGLLKSTAGPSVDSKFGTK